MIANVANQKKKNTEEEKKSDEKKGGFLSLEDISRVYQ